MSCIFCILNAIFKDFCHIKACTYKFFEVRQKLVTCSCWPYNRLSIRVNDCLCGMAGSIKLLNVMHVWQIKIV